MVLREAPPPGRSVDQLRAHYLVEKELALRLKNSRPADRLSLYAQVYDELFERVREHPQLRKKANPDERRKRIEAELAVLKCFMAPSTVFMEVGAGDCALSFAAAQHCRFVYAVDVSASIAGAQHAPANFRFCLSDGTSFDIPDGAVDLAYSNQLMEHLHPDDALNQLCGIHRVLAPRGKYVCVTPHPFNGPHDISQYFDETATGLHLKEYTRSELELLFRRAGFRELRFLGRLRGTPFRLPLPVVRLGEKAVGRLPRRLRRLLAAHLPCRTLLDAIVIGIK
ncbi:MAG TPA: class I SAM-dependent methyltransferase [Stellaceae bacterium]|nr:class I SAM-dependent methyltransferase [Stellaceae bacterium]